MSIDVKLILNQKLFLRDPQESSLGKKIIIQSVVLIEKLGFELFTFKKLAHEINSTEASIYRYFENKHLLLLYIMTWYWEWIDYVIDINWNNIDDDKQKLSIAIAIIADASEDEFTQTDIDLKLLHHIVIAESTKVYHTKLVDKENKKGLFLTYKKLAEKFVHLFEALNPSYPYPRVLASTLLEMSNSQVFYAQHLNRLTDIEVKREDYSQLKTVMEHFAFNLIGK
jgi:AcrR family transcriptional regulator